MATMVLQKRGVTTIPEVVHQASVGDKRQELPMLAMTWDRLYVRTRLGAYGKTDLLLIVRSTVM